MKKILLGLLIVIVGLAGFVLYTFSSTGFFREINNSDNYEVIASLPLYGAEDFTISYEDAFMLISQDDRAARHHGRNRAGGIYLLQLDSMDFTPQKLDSEVTLLPHGISLFKIDSGVYQLLVVNHYRKHTIEKFELRGDSLKHIKTFDDPAIVSPNDVVALDSERFYFTNDHGYTSKWGLLAEDYLGLSVSDVTFFNGKTYEKVADGIAYANGINISKDRSQLLVASPRKFQLLYYDISTDDGSLMLDEKLDVGSGIDNIELDEEGNLWMGSHPNLLAFTAYAAGKKPMAPSEIIYVNKEREASSLYENDGSQLSGTSVAAPYKDLVFMGTVMDDALLVLKRKR